MPHEQIRTTLSELRDQVQSDDAIDESLKAALVDTIARFDDALAADTPEAVQSQISEKARSESLHDRLAEFALEFEETHPAVAKNLHGLINALGQMGI